MSVLNKLKSFFETVSKVSLQPFITFGSDQFTNSMLFLVVSVGNSIQISPYIHIDYSKGVRKHIFCNVLLVSQE